MIKIALFGSEETINLVTPFENEIKDIRLYPFVYAEVTDLEELLPRAQDCDVYLFSGILSYSHAKFLKETFDKPAVYIEDNELSVSLTLLTVIHRNLSSLDRISFDLPDRKNLDSIIHQLQISPKPQFVKDFSWINNQHYQLFDTKVLFDFHMNLYKSGKTDFVITSVHIVYNQLLEKGIPCMHMVDAEKTIIDSLQKAKEASILNRIQLSQVAVTIVNLKTMTQEKNVHADTALLLLSEMQNLAKQVNGEVQQTSAATFEYFGTKGSIKFVFEKPELLKSLLSVANQHSLIVHMGSGFGMTVVEAKKNAAIALSYTEKEPDRHSFFVVTEDKIVIDQRAEIAEQTLSSNDEQIIYMAKKAKVSVTNLIKMKQLLQSRPVNRITSEDVSDYFEITRRSAERMLKKYMDAGWLQVIGEEQPHQNGRPRAIYRLDLPDS